MITFNRRLVFWIAKAYFKRWWKIIIFCFIIGLGIFFLLRTFFSYLLVKFPLSHKEIIGVVGSYTIDSMPSFIMNDISRGLTKLDKNGVPHPDLASSWKIQNNGKTYIFYLKKNIFFSDNTPLTSKNISFSFKDAKVKKPSLDSVSFDLADSYAPFLVTVSRPIFRNNFVGIGNFKISDIKINGTFVTSLTEITTNNPYQIRIYKFYPTQEALRIGFTLGEITQAINLTGVNFQSNSFDHFPNTKMDKNVNYNQLVTLFYNTADSVLSDKKVREALAYTFPDNFAYGQKAYSSIAPDSFAYVKDTFHIQDFTHAKLLLESSGAKNTTLELTISTLPTYLKTAKNIVELWSKLGIKTKVEIVETIPDKFQIFLGNFNVPQDPDQYSLWHSNQDNNISRISNPRIDKLLEDGRKTIDINKRIQIYADFQNTLSNESPAAFLYFPYSYTITRK